jgi:hypothetical protein
MIEMTKQQSNGKSAPSIPNKAIRLHVRTKVKAGGGFWMD